MVKIEIEINSCQECPYLKKINEHSTDGWDLMQDWCCTKHPENSMRRFVNSVPVNDQPGKLIQGGVEWHEERHIKIPDWCPAKS